MGEKETRADLAHILHTIDRLDVENLEDMSIAEYLSSIAMAAHAKAIEAFAFKTSSLTRQLNEKDTEPHG